MRPLAISSSTLYGPRKKPSECPRRRRAAWYSVRCLPATRSLRAASTSPASLPVGLSGRSAAATSSADRSFDRTMRAERSLTLAGAAGIRLYPLRRSFSANHGQDLGGIRVVAVEGFERVPDGVGLGGLAVGP